MHDYIAKPPPPVIDRESMKAARRDFCEYCGRVEWFIPSCNHIHHVSARGMGGGKRDDRRANLLCLCWKCHERYHRGGIPRAELVALADWRNRLAVKVRADGRCLCPYNCGRWSRPLWRHGALLCGGCSLELPRSPWQTLNEIVEPAPGVAAAAAGLDDGVLDNALAFTAEQVL